MTLSEKITFKKALIQACTVLLQQRAKTAEEAMKAAQEAANNEEKSSMGDKYETSRAMSQLDRDMNAKQLGQVMLELKSLEQINSETQLAAAGMGSVIITKEVIFFIAVGLGKINFQGSEMIVLSPGAPLAKEIHGKKEGEGFVFGKKNVSIQELF